MCRQRLPALVGTQWCSPLAVVGDFHKTQEAEAIKSSLEIPLEKLEPTITNHSAIKTKKEVTRKDTTLKVGMPKQETLTKTKDVSKDMLPE